MSIKLRTHCSCDQLIVGNDWLCQDCRWLRDMECCVCGDEMEYHAVHVFGDPAMGIQHEWLECNCGQRKYRTARGFWQ